MHERPLLMFQKKQTTKCSTIVLASFFSATRRELSVMHSRLAHTATPSLGGGASFVSSFADFARFGSMCSRSLCVEEKIFLDRLQISRFIYVITLGSLAGRKRVNGGKTAKSINLSPSINLEINEKIFWAAKFCD
jgi:hypothetical protein